jgi:hypothetical protein
LVKIEKNKLLKSRVFLKKQINKERFLNEIKEYEFKRYLFITKYFNSLENNDVICIDGLMKFLHIEIKRYFIECLKSNDFNYLKSFDCYRVNEPFLFDLSNGYWNCNKKTALYNHVRFELFDEISFACEISRIY